MIEFSKYAKIKDNYCVCYFGPSNEYLFQLKLLKPIIEKQFSGLKLFFGCRDEKTSLFEDQNFVLKVTELKERRHDFAHIHELRFNSIIHPVEEFLNDSEILNWDIGVTEKQDCGNKCVIITQGNYPTRNLEIREIDILKRQAKELGYETVINENINGAGLVVGVESYAIFDAASRGIKTKLIPSGFGTRLYQKMFLNGQVMHT